VRAGDVFGSRTASPPCTLAKILSGPESKSACSLMKALFPYKTPLALDV
jgi:hypothetical protein